MSDEQKTITTTIKGFVTEASRFSDPQNFEHDLASIFFELEVALHNQIQRDFQRIVQNCEGWDGKEAREYFAQAAAKVAETARFNLTGNRKEEFENDIVVNNLL